MPNYKLVYFDGRGRAETIRLAFAATGIAYEDHRIKKEEWPGMKPKTFAGYLPYMEVDGTILFESLAMAKYVAREGGLQPACSLSQARCDATLDVVNGFLEKASATKHTADAGAREFLQKELYEKVFPNVLRLLEKILGDKHFFVDNKLSLADLHFYSVFESFSAFYADWPKDSPKLKEHYDRIAAQPKIAEYLKKRPVTPF